jgi:hypothetical protein
MAGEGQSLTVARHDWTLLDKRVLLTTRSESINFKIGLVVCTLSLILCFNYQISQIRMISVVNPQSGQWLPC